MTHKEIISATLALLQTNENETTVFLTTQCISYSHFNAGREDKFQTNHKISVLPAFGFDCWQTEEHETYEDCLAELEAKRNNHEKHSLSDPPPTPPDEMETLSTNEEEQDVTID